MLSLEELNQDNYPYLAKLSLKEEQEKYVLNFEKCIAYQKENPFLRIFGIKYNDAFIGLTAFARWEDNRIPKDKQEVWFDEFFIDQAYQGKGLAKEAVRVILAEIVSLYNPKRIILSVCYENTKAIKLYESFGFKRTNYVYLKEEDSIIYKANLASLDEMIMIKPE